MNQERIRNFSIIAHIDHGKSTLADRFLEITHAVDENEMVDQFLDSMDLERERGITIKARTVRLIYQALNGQEYVLNLIDTPGHVDFSYEVSRSLAACEGALLVIDASQGVEAQTLANTYLALDNGLAIIPVINKIDLPSADVSRVKREIKESLGIEAKEALEISAKTGEGVREVLEAVVHRIPSPTGQEGAPLKALIFDSFFNSYRGVIALVKVVEGKLVEGSKIRMMATGRVAEVEEIGVMCPEMEKTKELSAGEVGYLIAGIKSVSDMKIGDTITDFYRPTKQPLPGYREAKPMVFCGFYPADGGSYENLRDALTKLRLNDPAFVFEPETSAALGFGFRCGFLGLLHMEIVKERLEREYNLSLVATAPSVAYRLQLKNGKEILIRNPSEMPKPDQIKRMEEPMISAVIVTPSEYVGIVMELCQERRGIFKNMHYLTKDRVEIHYDLPLAEILLNFYDQLKSRSRGYASLDYEHRGYQEADLVKLDILINNQPIDAFSAIVPKGEAYRRGKELVAKLRRVIPRQLFEVPVQAAIGSRVIARETIKAKRKDVLAKCYGGDVTRKRKLLQRQKEGKKKLKSIGRVLIPHEAFLEVLKVEEK